LCTIKSLPKSRRWRFFKYAAPTALRAQRLPKPPKTEWRKKYDRTLAGQPIPEKKSGITY
jgi:hypothetical protein